MVLLFSISTKKKQIFLKKIGNTESVSEWKSKGLSDEVIKPPNNTLAPKVKYTGKRM